MQVMSVGRNNNSGGLSFNFPFKSCELRVWFDVVGKLSFKDVVGSIGAKVATVPSPNEGERIVDFTADNVSEVGCLDIKEEDV